MDLEKFGVQRVHSIGLKPVLVRDIIATTVQAFDLSLSE